MEKWAMTRGLVLLAWLILMGLGVASVGGYSWLAGGWAALGYTSFGILAVLLVWLAIENNRKDKCTS